MTSLQDQFNSMIILDNDNSMSESTQWGTIPVTNDQLAEKKNHVHKKSTQRNNSRINFAHLPLIETPVNKSGSREKYRRTKTTQSSKEVRQSSNKLTANKVVQPEKNENFRKCFRGRPPQIRNRLNYRCSGDPYNSWRNVPWFRHSVQQRDQDRINYLVLVNQLLNCWMTICVAVTGFQLELHHVPPWIQHVLPSITEKQK